MRTLPDGELMKLVRQRQRQALSELYDRYAELVYSYAWRSLRDEGAAREIVQAVFLRLWTTESEYVPEKGRFSSWILAITRNLVIDRQRRLRKEAAHLIRPEPEMMERVPDRSESPEDRAIRGAFRRQIREAFRHLSAQQIQLLEHFYWQGYSLSELAELYGQPLGTVKSRLHQTLKVLRKHLPAEEGWR